MSDSFPQGAPIFLKFGTRIKLAKMIKVLKKFFSKLKNGRPEGYFEKRKIALFKFTITETFKKSH